MKVALVHQGIWDMDKLSMPLALGYLQAYAQQDPVLRDEMVFRIFNYRGSDQPVRMIVETMDPDPPDILACSVFGWNFRNFGQLAGTFRQLNPAGWTIFGGTHVANQAERVFRLYPEVDIVVNGEGEITFTDLLHARLDGRSPRQLGDVRGISFRTADGDIITTEPEPRIKDLDTIPSPFLTGAIPLFDESGEFLYDAVTMETNRGCPYKCSFCYWGGAVGQRMHSFSRDRLRAELDLFGRLGIQNICLCDSNFGMQRADRDFVEDFIQTRAAHHFPCGLTTSWAKNKGPVFYDIVQTMRQAGLHADFTLALQTVNPAALRAVGRHNMPINKFDDLCEWLHLEGLGSYAELIWGLPGETYDSFLEGYDRIARFVPRIATYTNLLLPNTAFDEDRKLHGFITVRGVDYDYEYVLAHSTMTLADNQRMHAFMFWARLMAEFMFLRYIWIPLRERCGLTQSTVLLDLDRWIEMQVDDPAAGALRRYRDEVVTTLDSSRTGRPIRVLYQHPGIPALIERWWNASVLPNCPPALHGFLRELMRYESVMRPVHEDRARQEGLELETIESTTYFVRRSVAFGYDISSAISPSADPSVAPHASPQPPVDYYYKFGFSRHIDNHEIVVQYQARTRDEVLAEAVLRDQGFIPEQRDRHVVGLPDSSLRHQSVELP